MMMISGSNCLQLCERFGQWVWDLNCKTLCTQDICVNQLADEAVFLQK